MLRCCTPQWLKAKWKVLSKTDWLTIRVFRSLHLLWATCDGKLRVLPRNGRECIRLTASRLSHINRARDLRDLTSLV
jgi:hypothetical protein